MKMSITIYGDNKEHVIAFPAKWVVCPHCDGAGKSSSYLGAYTASEWREQDDDFRENYMTGAYDRPCETCRGRTTVQQIDDEQLGRWHRRLLVVLEEQRRDFAEIDAVHAAERRMGA
jgi:hypothetical protein